MIKRYQLFNWPVWPLLYNNFMSTSSTSLNILIILGASRPNSQSAKVANFIQQLLTDRSGVNPTLVAVSDFQLDFDDQASLPQFHQQLEQADALLIITPEYNHSFPGKLKSLLDTEFAVYKHKPVAIASVSSGQFGGVRAVEALIPTLTLFGMIVTGLNLHFPNIGQVFDEAGQPVERKTIERSQAVIEDLIYLTKLVKAGQQAML